LQRNIEVKIENFFAELKRRNVYKVAVAYAVVAWLTIQAASIFLPAFSAPQWAMQIVILVLVIGFPIALAFSWAFEITPEGIVRESEVTADQSIVHHTGRKIVALTIVLAVVAAGLFVFQLLRARTATTPRQSEAATVSNKSIAVLPFDNLSGDPQNAYFSEGVQDEILTRLAKIAELKVISRTSTQRFKSAPNDLRQIAQQLGVANILEGSVQKANEQVRVNVQLINALTDTHLWAETYDRKLTDIFAVESEIARAVAEKLQARLTGTAEHVLASRPTENPEAHQLYLKGRFFWNKRTTENIRKAIDYFQQATEKDPAYALAHAGLGDAHAILPIYAFTAPNDDVPAALAAARKAVELDDSLAEAHTSLANALVFNVQLAEAEPEFRRALELNSNYATAHQWYGECLQGEGRFAEAVAELQRAHELDPLSLIINASYGCVLGEAGRPDEGIAQLHKTLEMDPTFWVAHEILGGILEGKGDLTGAAAEYERSMERYWTPNGAARLASLNARLGKKAEARKTLDDLTTQSRQHYVPPYALAVIHLVLGEKEEALRLLEKCLAQRSVFLQGDYGSLKTDKRLDALRDDPRFQKLVERFMSGKST
jgi:TolB-like protein/Tfp pilus assembly protein PilF